MEIQSNIEERVIRALSITIHINPKDKDCLVETLKTLLKKSKPDRLEEYIVNGLIQALESPETIVVPQKEESEILPEDVHEETHQDVKLNHPDKMPIQDKIRIVGEVKSRTDKTNQPINDWIKGSVKYAQEQMGIKTVPKSNSLESMYDWLVENRIIDTAGNPIPRS